jgi:hypothetical protein
MSTTIIALPKMDVFKYIIGIPNIIISNSLLYGICKYENEEMFCMCYDLMIRQKNLNLDIILSKAILGGNLNIVNKLLILTKISYIHIKNAISSNNIVMTKLLIPNIKLQNNNKHILLYGLTRSIKLDLTDIFLLILNELTDLEDIYIKYYNFIMMCINNDMIMLKNMYKYKFNHIKDNSSLLMESIASNGKINMLKYVIHMGVENININRLFIIAYKANNTKIIYYLLEHYDIDNLYINRALEYAEILENKKLSDTYSIATSTNHS